MSRSLRVSRRTGDVLRVSGERWLKAQTWELDLWRRQDAQRTAKGRILACLREVLMRVQASLEPLTWPDDWNLWWYQKFDGFAFVPPSLANALELGCGPYTNIRLIIDKRRVDHVFCSDPLAREYTKFNQGWLAWAHRNGRVWIDDHPAEQTPFASDYFDLVVVINVLGHVQDAVACLNSAIRVTKPGGQLVVGQDLTGQEDVTRWPQLEDVGHPISIHHTFLDNLLMHRFSVIMRKVLPRDEGRNPEYHYGTYVFAGRKLEGDAKGN